MSSLIKIIDYCQFPTGQLESSESKRIFHGRGHAYKGFEHITIDWLAPVILITLFAEEPIEEIEKLIDPLLENISDCKSIQLQHRYQLAGPIDVIHGDKIEQLIICESKLKYHITLGKARNTGLFLDMKNGRDWVRDNGRGMRVLNLFSYTCGFSIAAIAGGATSVVNIDMSSPALNIGRQNHRINQHDLKHVRFEKLNILKSFGRLKKRGPFDLLICDPPTFQKGSVDITKDYPKIMRRLDEFMASNSTLLLCLNAPELDREFLIENMRINAPRFNYIDEIKPPNVYIDAESKGLKVLTFKS